MPALALKHYQTQALEALESSLHRAAALGAASAFTASTGYGWNTEPFGDLPCVCLRIPTSGGKTLLAAHAIGRMAGAWPGRHPQRCALRAPGAHSAAPSPPQRGLTWEIPSVIRITNFHASGPGPLESAA
jgi:hypothetical protein